MRTSTFAEGEKKDVAWLLRLLKRYPRTDLCMFKQNVRKPNVSPFNDGDPIPLYETTGRNHHQLIQPTVGLQLRKFLKDQPN